MPTNVQPTSGRPGEDDGGFRLTGRHVFIILCCFFGVMLAANLTMARFALKTFSGEVTAHPYERGLRFNAEVDALRAQDKLGWTFDGKVALGVDSVAGVDIEARDASGAPLTGLEVSVVLEAPADRKRDRTLKVREVAPGRYAARGPAMAGAWDVVLTAGRGGERQFQSRNRVTLK